MKFLKLLGMLVALAAMTIFVPSTAATPTSQAKPASHVVPGGYSGTTSQGHQINFNVVEGGANDFIDQWGVGFNLQCVKSGRTPGVGHGFGGFHVDIDPTTHTFAFSYDGAFFFFFNWNGTFTSATTAEGTALVNWGGIFNKRRAELCRSTRVSWTAAHTGAAAKPDLSGVDVYFEVTRGEDGQFSVQQVK
jgi:hypothetical protein